MTAWWYCWIRSGFKAYWTCSSAYSAGREWCWMLQIPNPWHSSRAHSGPGCHRRRWDNGEQWGGRLTTSGWEDGILARNLECKLQRVQLRHTDGVCIRWICKLTGISCQSVKWNIFHRYLTSVSWRASLSAYATFLDGQGPHLPGTACGIILTSSTEGAVY